MTKHIDKDISKYSVSGRPSEGGNRSAATHKAIIDAALQVLEEAGYQGFSIEAVAARARAGKPTIYRWWKSKGALLIEIGEQVFSPLFNLPELGSVAGELDQYMLTLWGLLHKYPNIVKGAFSAAQHDTETALQLRDRLLSRRRAIIRGILSRGLDRGEIPRGTDIDTAADIFLGVNVFRLLIDEPIDQRTGRQLVSILLHGVAAVDRPNA